MNDSWQDAVILITGGVNGNGVYGTGFVVHRDKQGTYVLTCTHVVDDVGGKERVHVNDIPATVIASGPADSIDVAVLRVVGLENKPLLRPYIKDKTGGAFELAGYYHLDDNPKKKLVFRRLRGILSDVIQAGMALDTLVTLWEIEITSNDELRPGNSGSPVIDENNCVIGIVNTRLNSNKKRGWVTPIKALEKIWPTMPPSLFVQNTLPKFPKAIKIKAEKLSWLYTLDAHTKPVRSVAISPDSHTLVSGSDDKTIKVWDLSTVKGIRTLIGHTEPVSSVAISPDGHTLASGSSDKTIKVWDLFTGKELRTLTGHTKFVMSMAISPDGHTLVSGSGDKTIKVWDLFTGKELRTLTGHRHTVTSVAISPDSHILASGSIDKKIKVWELSTGRELYTLIGTSGLLKWVECVAISPDGHMLVSGSGDKTIKVWELSSGRQLLTLTGHTDSISSLAISPDGRILMSAANSMGHFDETVKIWELSTGRQLRTLTEATYGINSLAISPDGRTLVGGSGSYPNAGKIEAWGM